MQLKKNVLLHAFSTFKIGGKAEYFLHVKEPDDLIEAIKWAKDKKIPYKIFAGASNVLFPDNKVKGLVIRFFGGEIKKIGKNKFLVDGGVPLKTAVKKSINLGWQGLETLSGIPGTVGGAVIGNAGAYGHSISEIVEKIEIWDPFGGVQDKGRRCWLKNSDCRFSYRESIFSAKGGSASGGKKRPFFLLRAVLEIKPGNKRELRKVSREILKIRAKKYSSKIQCPGSFFKNILVKDAPKNFLERVERSKIREGKIPAGYLLEEIGAKGMRVGKIQVAKHHGNLIMNTGGGTARDVKKIAVILKRRVKSKFGIELEEEVRYF